MLTQPHKKKKIFLPLLLLAVAALAVSAWQWRTAMREQDASDAQARMKPKTQESSPLMDFTGLQAQNPDIIAWLTIEELEIDYPVVQGKDNSYYLDHTAENIAKWIVDTVPHCYKATVVESENNEASYEV